MLKVCQKIITFFFANQRFLKFLLVSAIPFMGHGQSNEPNISPKIIVGNIHFTGNTKTKSGIIGREMAISSGAVYDSLSFQEALEIDRRKIVNTNLFITVSMEPTLNEDSLHTDINVVLKERWYFIILPIFQLADRNFNEWWYDRNRDLRRTIYGTYVSYGNVTGRADKLRLLVELGFVPKFDISYAMPYIDKAKKTGLTIGASFSINKATAFRTWNDKLDYLSSEAINKRRFYTFVNLTRRNKFYNYHAIDFRWSNTSISDTIVNLNVNYLENQLEKQQKYFQLTYTYNYDKRDNVQYPLSGQSMGFLASKMGLLPTDDIDLTYAHASYRKYFKLSEKWYANSGVRARVSLPKKQPYLQTIGLGYRNDLVRGYELYVIDGQHYALWKNEIKYRLFSIQKHFSWIPVKQFNTIPIAVYLNSFADAAYVKNYYPEMSNTKLGNTLLYGAGTGLDVVTFYNMVLKFTYSVNAKKEGRFFFNIAREF